MSTNLYHEAIAEAKKLREIAEQNAKNRIVEAVTPRIRRLIEQELGGDNEDDLSADDWEDSGMEDDYSADPMAMDTSSGAEMEIPTVDSYEAPVGQPDELVGDSELSVSDGQKVTLNITVETDEEDDDDDKEDLKEADDEDDDGDDDKDEKLEEVTRRAVSRLNRQRYAAGLNRATRLARQLNETRSRTRRNKIMKELASLRSELILNTDKASVSLAMKINNLLKENDTMSRRTRRNRRLNENAWWLREGDEEELDLGDDELEGGDDLEADAGDEDVDVEAVTMAVEDLVAALPGVELSDEAAEDLEGDEEEDLEGDDMDEMVEISESMLRRELARMQGTRRQRRARPSSRRRTSNRKSRLSESRRRRLALARRRRINEAEAVDAASSFGGGSAEQELFEVDEATLINALAEELGDAHKVDQNTESPEGGAEKMAAHFGGGSAESLPAGEISERRRLYKRAQLAERKAVRAQKELRESNLFNAKLLYVNKLMQQHDLNSKQQRAIVEALDNAKTLREAKLLYKSLTESLRKRTASSGKTLTEGKSSSGSSSRSLRSAAPAKTGSELSRWAKLAGLQSK